MLSFARKHTQLSAMGVFTVFFIWWLLLQFISEPTDSSRELFSGVYGTMALFGAIVGLKISKTWGGRKSFVGLAILMLSLGLFAQVFGQISYSLYTLILKKEVPYPSIGDIGYFGTIPLYIYGVWQLGKTVSIKTSLKSFANKALVTVLPIAILTASYLYFLKGYEADWTHPLTVFLDLGYPLGPAAYLSLTILVYTLSRKFLGGIMRPVILLVLFALAMQYLADFFFLYQVHQETWVTGGFNELMFLFAYFVMTIALLRFRSAYQTISNRNKE
mgnify:CR=1 FL=1